MNATKWFRRAGARPWFTGSITCVRYYGKPDESVQLNLTSFDGDDVDRLKIELTLEEAAEVRDSLTKLLEEKR